MSYFAMIGQPELIVIGCILAPIVFTHWLAYRQGFKSGQLAEVRRNELNKSSK